MMRKHGVLEAAAMQRMRWMLRSTLGRDVTLAMIVKLLLLGTVLLLAVSQSPPVNDAAATAVGILGNPTTMDVRP
jgi:hypothetical protein